MTRKQLQTLISAGVFSASLLSGIAYADNAPTGTTSPTDVSTSTGTVKHHHHRVKNMAKHACAGQNSCKGQGGCKTSDGGCAGKNSCKGKGGCATDGSKKPS